MSLPVLPNLIDKKGFTKIFLKRRDIPDVFSQLKYCNRQCCLNPRRIHIRIEKTGKRLKKKKT